MAAAVEGAQVDFDTALEIEGRYFVDLATGQVAKNMIQAFFFDLQAVNGDARRGPRTIETFQAEEGRRARRRHDGRRDRLRVREGRHRGRAQGRRRRRPPSAARATREKLVDKGVARGKHDAGEGRRAARADHADRPTRPTAAGADLVIEAVFEDPTVKAQVFAEIEPHLADGRAAGLQHLDAADHRPRRGRLAPGRLHRAALLLPGGQDAAAGDHQGRADQRRDAVPRARRRQADQKTPIVVNDSRGFFTSRVIGTFINEGIAMLDRGRPGADDRAGLLAGRLPGAGAAAHATS